MKRKGNAESPLALLDFFEKFMRIPLQITIRDIEHSEALETRIRDKAIQLEEFFDHIISCRVVVEVPHKHHQGRQFSVRIDIGVPGNEIVVNRDHAEDVYVALRDAFDAAKRQLEDYARKLHGDVKTHQPKRQPQEIDEVDVEQ